MSEKGCTIRTRKFMTNRLLSRKQFVRNGKEGVSGERRELGLVGCLGGGVFFARVVVCELGGVMMVELDSFRAFGYEPPLSLVARCGVDRVRWRNMLICEWNTCADGMNTRRVWAIDEATANARTASAARVAAGVTVFATRVEGLGVVA